MVTNKGRHTAVGLDTADWNKRHEYWQNVGSSPGWVIGGGLGLMGFCSRGGKSCGVSQLYPFYSSSYYGYKLCFRPG